MATVTTYTKAGLDAKAAPLATETPLAAGAGTSGTSGAAARADHVHPRQTDLLSHNYISGRWASPIGPRDGSNETDFINERCLAYPFSWFPRSGAKGFGDLAIHVSTAGNAGAVASCRIFELVDGVANFEDVAVAYPDIDVSTTGVKTVSPSAASGPQSGFFVFACLVTGATTEVPKFMRAVAWGSPEMAMLQSGPTATRQSVRVPEATTGYPTSGVLGFVDNVYAPWFNLMAV